MKRLLALLTVLALMAAVFAGCAQKTATDPQTPAKDAGNRTFVLGLDASFPPMGFTDAKGDIVGFDIDVAAEVCARLGWELKCQPIEWDAKEFELSSKNIDCIWNGFTMTDERKAALLFSDPYMENDQVIIVPENSAIKGSADLVGKKVGVQADSSGSEAVESNAELRAGLGELVPFSDFLTALMDLEVGGVDALVADEILARYYIEKNNKPLVILDEAIAAEEYGVGFRKDDAETQKAVNDAMSEMAKDGTLAAISEKWFTRDITTIGK